MSQLHGTRSAAVPVTSKTFGIIGGGIIGLAIGYKLATTAPGARIILFEKESDVGQHQSGHNSGVLHAGLYYKPGSLKARLAVSGIGQMTQFCEKYSIAHEICGKMVVASSDHELPRLHDLFERGTQNGLHGLRRVGPEEMREIEPHVAGVAGILVPQEGIVDYAQVCRTLKTLLEDANGKVCTNSEVQSLRQIGPKWIVSAAHNEEHVDFIFNCAGLQCDRVLTMAGERRTTRIIPFRGEYYFLNEAARPLVRNLIYPVPDPRFPFLGVHFTRMIHGGVEAGPNAVLALAREGYRKTDFRLRDAADAITYQGFWRLLWRYPAMCTYELWRSLSKNQFCRSLQRLVPEVKREHLVAGSAGIRAQAVQPDGTPCQDFEFVLRQNALHLLNAPSPGATASLAIADFLLAKSAPAISS